MMELNQPALDFELPDLQGRYHKLSEYRGRLVILNFWSAECPQSERSDHYLVRSLQLWGDAVALLSIASNRNESVQMLEEAAKARQIPTVLIDAEQVVADLYGAIATPHVFVVDREGSLRYRGAVDDLRFRQPKPTRLYLEEAIQALLEGRNPDVPESLAYGCAIVREI